MTTNPKTPKLDKDVRPSPSIGPLRSTLESGFRLNDAGGKATDPAAARAKGYLKKNKSRPLMKRHALAINSRFFYSVDDDIHDEIGDNNDGEEYVVRDKKYIDGYHDALRDLYKHKRIGIETQKKADLDFSQSTELNSSRQESIGERTPKMVALDTEGERLTPVHHSFYEEEDELEEGAKSDTASQRSTSLSETLESLNLKDRQNAINVTHPFGIKIWKPSIYKKSRLVAVRAEEDIHDYDPRRPTGPIFFGVYILNIIWSLTFGLTLYLVCAIGAVIVFIFSGFAWHKHSRPYVRLLLNLGKYWFLPFGKLVLLNKDENYLNEDELDGRSLLEFHRWRLQEEGRLFFAPPRRMTNSESRPLLKDHKGRPLGAAYESAVEGPSESVENAIDDEAVKTRLFGRGSWSLGRLMFYLFFYGVLQPLLFLISLFCWLFVFTIPMSNLNLILCEHVRRRPLALHFEREKDFYKRVGADGSRKPDKNQSIILCTYRCCGLHYYKFTLGGTNIFFINLLTVVAFVILDYYILKEGLGWDTWYTDPLFLFSGCLFSIIPLAYFIGQAVASISAQSSMGVGAVINAFFSTIVEIFLYCVALNQEKGKLVEGLMIGSILAGVLLLPGLSMCGGALNRKTQRYNPRSAGVSSTMLLFAMVAMFAPSLFYQLYGSYEIRCKLCGFDGVEECTTCLFIQPRLNLDKLYYEVLRPFSLLVAVVLFLAYMCGLYFTLKTHASLIWATSLHEQRKEPQNLHSPSVLSLDHPPRTSMASVIEGPDLHRKELIVLVEESGGHDAPNWSNTRSLIILLGATLLYAIIAEILVDNVDAVLSNFPINPKFLGLTVFALVPNTTEFVNAISFAVGGNVALSMEIGSAYALQVVLIQIPCLVLYSVYKGFTNIDMIFTLIFPRWDVLATLVSIFLFTYIYAEGKSNYFKGVILILIYIVVLVGFYLDDVVASLDDGYLADPSTVFG